MRARRGREGRLPKPTARPTVPARVPQRAGHQEGLGRRGQIEARLHPNHHAPHQHRQRWRGRGQVMDRGGRESSQWQRATCGVVGGGLDTGLHAAMKFTA